MKLNWKVLIAIVVLVGATIWGVNSLRTYSYSGTDLNFGVGGGPVTVTNPSVVPVPVQLVSSRAFRVSSSIANVSGRSTTQGSGRGATQLFELAVPFGVSELVVTGDTNINFVASTNTLLDVVVQPLNAENSRTTLILAVVAVLGSLFFLSSTNDHRWISAARRKKALTIATTQEAERQTFKRTFGRINPDKS